MSLTARARNRGVNGMPAGGWPVDRRLDDCGGPAPPMYSPWGECRVGTRERSEPASFDGWAIHLKKEKVKPPKSARPGEVSSSNEERVRADVLPRPRGRQVSRALCPSMCSSWLRQATNVPLPSGQVSSHPNSHHGDHSLTDMSIVLNTMFRCFLRLLKR